MRFQCPNCHEKFEEPALEDPINCPKCLLNVYHVEIINGCPIPVTECELVMPEWGCPCCGEERMEKLRLLRSGHILNVFCESCKTDYEAGTSWLPYTFGELN